MKTLLAGMESEKRIDKLLSLTSIKSENKIAALKYHLVKGRPANVAAVINDVDNSNFTKCLNELNRVARIVEDIKEMDTAHLVNKLTITEEKEGAFQCMN